jgi:uncharacterized protein
LRISEAEHNAIVQCIHDLDAGAEVYLFGSRTNNDLKGGDIDLLVISNVITISGKIDLLLKIKDAIGEQKIDILVRKPSDAKDDHFVQSIMPTAKRLDSKRRS